jgi:2-haloacid dehalogenase
MPSRRAHTPPRAVLFDAYGTLFDVYSVSALAEQIFPGHGARLAQLWRDKQIEYTRLVTGSNHGAHYQSFWSLTEAALRYAIDFIAIGAHPVWAEGQFSPENKDKVVHQLMNQYRHLSAFPENKTVLEQLKARGVPMGILSNGDPEMLRVAVKSAGLDALLDHLISVDAIRKYKTHPDAYALGTQTLGLQAKQILFVSSNGWDALGATWFGYQTLWVNRSGAPPETICPAPTRVGTSLRDALSFFD